MAETQRKRIIANRGKRNKPRTMSDKQIRIFGSPAQKAALKRRKSAKRSRAKSKTNKVHRSATRPRGTAVKTNAGPIIGYTLANKPAAKKGHKKMAKTKRKNTAHRKAKAGYGHSKYKRNTGRKRSGHKGHRPRTKHRRNMGGGTNRVSNLATNAVFVIAGALGSKLLTQMVLGSNNVGIMGYAGNAVVGAGLWLLVEKVLKNRAAADSVLLGTAVQIVLRLINDYTPFGQYVAQLGMGDYQAQSFVTPQTLVDPYNRAEIQIPAAWRQTPIMLPAADTTVSGAAASAGVGGYGGGNLYGGGSGLY